MRSTASSTACIDRSDDRQCRSIWEVVRRPSGGCGRSLSLTSASPNDGVRGARTPRKRSAWRGAQVGPWDDRVGGVGRQLDEERAVVGRRPLDHPHGLVGEDVGHVAGLLDGPAVVRQRRVLVGLEPGDRPPVVPARRGLRVGQVAVQVLPDEAGEVAGLLQRDRQRGPLEAEVRRLHLGRGVPVGGVGRDPVVGGVPARQQRGPGRAAEGVRRDRLGEGEALGPRGGVGSWAWCRACAPSGRR